MDIFYKKKTTYVIDKSLFLLFCCVTFGCAKTDNFTASDMITTKNGASLPSHSDSNIIYSDSTQNSCVVLSDAYIANPYNVDTLRRAMALAYPNGHSTYRFTDIQPTHYQIRFLPKNEDEFQLLDDSGIITTPIPLDRKVEQGGTSYFDPELQPTENPYTWQYSIVSVNQTLPNIEYEIIGEIRRIDIQNVAARNYREEDLFWVDVREKAYEMCGYDADALRPSLSPRFEIRGKVEVYDSEVNDYIGSIGARLVMTGLTYIETADVLDWSGNYVIPRYVAEDYNARTILKWQNQEWMIFDFSNDNDTRYQQAIYTFPNQPYVHNLKIKGGKQEKFATVTRAMHRIYFGNNLGLPRPNTMGGITVKCIDASVSPSGSAGSYNGSSISIWLSGWSSFNQYQTMIHEMAHAMEKLCLGNKGYSWISESWASLVENYIAKLEYKELSEWYSIVPELTFDQTENLPGGAGMPVQPGAMIPFTKPNFYNKQKWPLQDNYKLKDSLWEYTPLLIDLVDSDNQREYQRLHCAKMGLSSTLFKQFPSDKVSGYTLPQIATAYSMLHHVTDNVAQLKEFKEIIKTVRPNTTLQKVHIDTLINKYIYYCEKRYK